MSVEAISGGAAFEASLIALCQHYFYHPHIALRLRRKRLVDLKTGDEARRNRRNCG
jgi:hypothetical protein